nr:MAG TPA: hypothetical protein [Caudoviricetes sp.]
MVRLLARNVGRLSVPRRRRRVIVRLRSGHRNLWLVLLLLRLLSEPLDRVVL